MSLEKVALLLLLEACLLSALFATTTQWCLDRRDYAPGFNTYRLIDCALTPAYGGDKFVYPSAKYPAGR